MTTSNPDFSLDSKKRIANVVRLVEQLPEDGVNTARPSQSRMSAETFWAILSARDGTYPWRYSWSEVLPQENGTWAAPPDARLGHLDSAWASPIDKTLAADLSGRVALLRRAAYLKPAAGSVPAQWTLMYLIIGADGIDLEIEGSTVITGARFINLPSTRGTSNILEFVTNGNGADFQFINAGSDYQVLQKNSGNVVWDDVRAS